MDPFNLNGGPSRRARAPALRVMEEDTEEALSLLTELLKKDPSGLADDPEGLKMLTEATKEKYSNYVKVSERLGTYLTGKGSFTEASQLRAERLENRKNANEIIVACNYLLRNTSFNLSIIASTPNGSQLNLELEPVSNHLTPLRVVDYDCSRPHNIGETPYVTPHTQTLYNYNTHHTSSDHVEPNPNTLPRPLTTAPIIGSYEFNPSPKIVHVQVSPSDPNPSQILQPLQTTATRYAQNVSSAFVPSHQTNTTPVVSLPSYPIVSLPPYPIVSLPPYPIASLPSPESSVAAHISVTDANTRFAPASVLAPVHRNINDSIVFSSVHFPTSTQLASSSASLDQPIPSVPITLYNTVPKSTKPSVTPSTVYNVMTTEIPRFRLTTPQGDIAPDPLGPKIAPMSPTSEANPFRQQTIPTRRLIDPQHPIGPVHQVYQMPIKKFQGDPMDFWPWINQIKDYLSRARLSPIQVLHLLEQNSGGSPQRLLSSTLTARREITYEDLDEVWEDLSDCYGSSQSIATQLIRNIESLPPIRGGHQGEQLRNLYQICRLVLHHMPKCPELSTMNFASGLKIIREKLPENIQGEWQKFGQIFKRTHDESHPSFSQFVSFLKTQMQEKLDPQFEIVIASTKPTRVLLTDVEPLMSEPPGGLGREGTKRCLLHHNSTDHTLPDCREFRTLPSSEKWRFAYDNFLCFRCLQSHRARECHSAVRCAECGGNHLHVMHDANRPRSPTVSAVRHHPREPPRPLFPSRNSQAVEN